MSSKCHANQLSLDKCNKTFIFPSFLLHTSLCRSLTIRLVGWGTLMITSSWFLWFSWLRVRSAGLGRSVCQCVPAGNTDPLPCHAQSQAVTYCHVLGRAKEDGDKECPHSQGHFHPTTRKRDKSIKSVRAPCRGWECEPRVEDENATRTLSPDNKEVRQVNKNNHKICNKDNI